MIRDISSPMLYSERRKKIWESKYKYSISCYFKRSLNRDGMEKNNLRVLKLEAEVDGNLATKCICKRYFILDRSCVDYVMVGESVKFILTTCK